MTTYRTFEAMVADWERRTGASDFAAFATGHKLRLPAGTIDGSELSEEHRDLALTVLGLTVAAGGKIVCRHADMMNIGRYRLTVTKDVQTGDKIYEAKPL